MARNHSTDLVLPIDDNDHVLGDPRAPVTVLEYGDFQCPICKQAAPAVKLLLKRFESRVLFAYRHFPQESIHSHATQAAEAAEYAPAQGRFWPMHDLLFANQEYLDPKHLLRYAEQIELDQAQFTAAMDDEVYLQRVRDHLKGGRLSRVRATPGFVVNWVIVDVSFGLRAPCDAVEAALQ